MGNLKVVLLLLVSNWHLLVTKALPHALIHFQQVVSDVKVAWQPKCKMGKSCFHGFCDWKGDCVCEGSSKGSKYFGE